MGELSDTPNKQTTNGHLRALLFDALIARAQAR
jgi:hypothetical protein